MQRYGIAGAVALAVVFLLASCGGPAVPRGSASLEGTVVDATTGLALPGARACFVFRGSVTGICATSDASGAFQLARLPAGDHAVQVTKAGFTGAREGVQLTDGATATIRVALSPGLSSGELRIVLSWGADPRDLDSHLWVPQSGSPYEVYFDDLGSCSAGPWTCLDVDDTTSYGPETITVKQLQSGTYSYAVHWYAGTGSWAGSDAVVRVYDASGLVATYAAPGNASEPDASGAEWWYVFDLNGSTLTPKDTLSTNPPLSSAVTSLGTK